VINYVALTADTPHQSILRQRTMLSPSQRHNSSFSNWGARCCCNAAPCAAIA